MKKVLILNLTRMGDLLMTTPLIKNLKTVDSDVEISVLSNKKFSEVCKYNPYIDHLYELDIHQFENSAEGADISFIVVYQYLNSIVENMRSLKFDTLINLTHSKLSAVLSSLLGIQDVRGFQSSESGNRLVNNMWMVYFCNLLFNRQYNLFNLVDIYLRSGDILQNTEKSLTFQIPESSSEWADSYLYSNSVCDKNILITFQPASSRPDRRWPVKHFIELARLLLKDERVKIVILGVESEAELGREIAGAFSPRKVINAVGKTTIPQLGALLKRSDFLVTNDTGTMHIASAAGCRIIALFFTHALVHETGPYGDGHIVFQSDIPCSPCSHQTKCNNMVCKEYIVPEDVFTLISTLIKGEEVNNLKSKSGFAKKARLFISRFAEDGMCEFVPILKKPLRISDIMAYSYKELWKYFLNNKKLFKTSNSTDKMLESSVGVTSEAIKSFFLLDNINELIPSLDTVIESFLTLADKSEKGLSAVSEILDESKHPKPDLLKIKGYGDIVLEIDTRIESTGLNTPETNPLVKMFSFGKENLEGEDYVLLAAKTADLYTSLNLESHAMANNLKILKKHLLKTYEEKQCK